MFSKDLDKIIPTKKASEAVRSDIPAYTFDAADIMTLHRRAAGMEAGPKSIEESLGSIREVALGQQNCLMASIVDRVAMYYTASNFDIAPVLPHLAAIVKSAPKYEQLRNLDDALTFFEQKKWPFGSLVEVQAALLKSKVKMVCPADSLCVVASAYACLRGEDKDDFNNFNRFKYIEQVQSILTRSVLHLNPATPEVLALHYLLARNGGLAERLWAAPCLAAAELALSAGKEDLIICSAILRQQNFSQIYKIDCVRDYLVNIDRVGRQHRNSGGKHSEAIVNAFRQGASAVLADRGSLTKYTEKFLELVDNKFAPEQLKCFSIIYGMKRKIEKVFPAIQDDRIDDQFGSWKRNPPTPQICRNFINAYESGLVSTPRQIAKYLAELTLDGATRTSGKLLSFEPMRNFIGLKSYLSAPARMEENVFVKMADLHSRLNDICHGFATALRFDVTRLPGETVSPALRFALELANVSLIHAGDGGGYPAGGMLVNNLRVDKIFVGEPGAENPLESFQEAWPSLNNGLKNLSKLEIIMTRGIFGFTVKSNEGFTLSSPLKQSHFSVLFFNDHYLNPLSYRAILVDSTVLSERVSPCLKEWSSDWRIDSLGEEVFDINKAGLRPEQLLALNTPEKIVAIDLGSISSVVRGPAFSLSPNSKPYFSYESNMRKAGKAEFDIFGHADVASLDNLSRRLGIVTDAQWKLSHEAASILKEYLDTIDAFRMAMAYAHKGFAGHNGIGFDYRTKGRQDQSRNNESQLFNLQSEGSATAERGAAEGGFVPSEPSLGMLLDGMKWHNYLKVFGQPPSASDPVIASCQTLRYSDVPDKEVVLDLHNMELKAGVRRTKLLDEDGQLIANAQAIWLQEVISNRMQDSFRDLRILARESLG